MNGYLVGKVSEIMMLVIIKMMIDINLLDMVGTS